MQHLILFYINNIFSMFSAVDAVSCTELKDNHSPLVGAVINVVHTVKVGSQPLDFVLPILCLLLAL